MDPFVCATTFETLLRQYGRSLADAVLVKIAIVACAAPALAAQLRPGSGPTATPTEPASVLAVAVLVRLVEFGRRVAAEARRRTRPAARQKGTSTGRSASRGWMGPWLRRAPNHGGFRPC